MSKALAPWHPRLCSFNSPAHVGTAHVNHKNETYDENMTYYRFAGVGGFAVKIEVKRISDLPSGMQVFHYFISVPLREDIDFALPGFDFALYPENLKQHIKSVIDPIVADWFKNQMSKPPYMGNAD